MKIENIKQTAFESKEHYLAFRQAWKNYVNSGGSPTCEQHLIYAAFRGVDISKMFTPITNPKTLECQGKHPYWAFSVARSNIKFSTPTENRTTDWVMKRYKTLVEPFGDTVNLQMMQMFLIELDSIKL